MNAAERLDWLQERRVGAEGTRLFSTDVGAVLGVSRWQTKLGVFNDKLMLTDTDKEVSELMKWGLELEPFLARRYADHIGIKDSELVDVGRGAVIDPTNGRFGCSPDIAHVKGRRRGCELKVTGFKEPRGTLHDNGFDYGWGDEGSADVPDDHSIQCHWCMSVMRRVAEHLKAEPVDAWDVAVLFGGRTFEVFTVLYDERVDKLLRKSAQRFLEEHVDKEMPPDAVVGDEKLITAMFRGDKDKDMLVPEDDLLSLSEGYVNLHAALKAMQADVDARKVRLKQIIGDSTGIKLPNGYLSYFAAKPKRKEVTDWEKVARMLTFDVIGGTLGVDKETAQDTLEEAVNTHTKVFEGWGKRSLRVNIKKEKS